MAQAVLSMVNTYHIIGFVYSLALLLIGMFIISCDSLYSKRLYRGTWCNISPCLPEGMTRICLSIMFKIFLLQIVLLSLALSGI
jgi:hypothetical protein